MSGFDENGSYFTNDEEALLFDEYEYDEEYCGDIQEFDNDLQDLNGDYE